MRHQRGATLIVVLILMLLISIVGLYAIRHSVFSLKLATNAQVQTLLMQTSDVALDHLEKNFKSNEASHLASTPVGQVLLAGNQGKELQFCFKPTQTGERAGKGMFFDLAEFRIVERLNIEEQTGVSAALSGDVTAVCDPESMFSIGRKAVVTQVAVVSPDDPTVEMGRFELAAKNSDLKEVNVETKRIRVIVTSFAPALAANADIADINTCLQERMMDDTLLNNRADPALNPSQVKVETVHECLNQLGVPLNTQLAEYVVRLSETKH
jgi:type II secretory pathway pseudopilin PulG